MIVTKVGIFFVSNDESALCILEDHKLHPELISFVSVPQIVESQSFPSDVKESSFVNQSFPNFVQDQKILKQIEVQQTEIKITEQKILQKRIIRQNRYRNAREVEREYAPKLLQDYYGFTDVRVMNGQPIDLEAWKNGVRYFIDVKYYKILPPILKGT